jgi:hypothetical protein
VHGVATEVTQKVGVLFHHRDFYSGAGQQEAKHHARPVRRRRLDSPRGRRHQAPADLGVLAAGRGMTRRISVRPVNGFLSWWDGIELWLSGLAFVLQALLVMPVVLMLAYFMTAVLDRLLGKGIQLMRRGRRADAALG